MQGRLLPPVDGRIQAFPASAWHREFQLARAAGVDGIEWIYEEPGAAENPLGSDAGLARMGALTQQHGVRVDSLCADWFMDRPLLAEGDEARRVGIEKLRWVLTRAAAAGIRRVVLPFVDASALRDERAVNEATRLIASTLPVLDEVMVELHLETSLPPEEFAALLERIDHPRLRANYDTGNSASLGYDSREEFAAYGARVGSVHVKDRVLGGGTVPLGQGAADLELVFALLHERGWERPLVLQTARGQEGLEAETVRADTDHVRRLWARSGSRAWT